MSSTRKISREQALAFRLAGHNLSTRRPIDDLLKVAGACGIRNSPPGSAGLAFVARLNDVTPEILERALAEAKSLVEVVSVRLSPAIVPSSEIAVFTLGALPSDEESMRTHIEPKAETAGERGWSAVEIQQAAVAAAERSLAGRHLARGALSAAMTEQLPDAANVWCRPCASRHVTESIFRLTGVSGAFVIAHRDVKSGIHARPEDWLGSAVGMDRTPARAELVRRYLHCFGPSTAEHFAAWAGISPADGRRSWDALAAELEPVDFAGRRAWIHVDDVERAGRSPDPVGVRLLPPYDSYLDQRDRAVLVPDTARQKLIWRILGNPGVVLVDGEVAGVWRPQKKGKRLLLKIESFEPLAAPVRQAVESEAARLAPFRAVAAVDVAFAG